MWAKLDDNYYEHPKVLAAGERAEVLWARSIAYACRFETDGKIPKAVVVRLCPTEDVWERVSALLKVGLWELDGEDPNGETFLIHDFLDYNPSHEDRAEDRAATASRVAAHRARKKEAKAAQEALDAQAAQDAVSEEPVAPAPDHVQAPDHAPISGNGVTSGVTASRNGCNDVTPRYMPVTSPLHVTTTGPAVPPAIDVAAAARIATQAILTLKKLSDEPSQSDSGATCNGVCNASPVPVPVHDPLPESDHSPFGGVATSQANDAPAPVAKPRTARPQRAIVGATDCWNAYVAAYSDRYGVPPVCNAKVMGQISQLIQRVGKADAVLMCRWWPSHRAYRSVADKHTIGLLLSQCEGLHTEMRRGVTVHARDAREVDEQSANHAMWQRIGQELDRRKIGGGGDGTDNDTG